MVTERVLTEDQLVQRVHDGFAKKYQEEITVEDVRRALKDLRLADPPARPACQLRINRLSIGGQKILKEEPEAIPIQYDQEFKSGVNVVLIEDNDVGKSSILKTIKFALTGDDGDYDADVKKWITDIRLQFSLNDDCYTVVISCTADQFAVLYTGVEKRQPDDVEEDLIVFTAADRNEFQDSLRQFFFDRIGLTRLSWVLPPSDGQDEPRDGGTTWLTYFQALHIPDGGDRYLLCDKEHSFGNQDGLIFSSFLGLHLVEQLNWLGVESSKQQKVEKGTASERDDLTKQLDNLEGRNREVAEQLEKLSRHLRERRDSFVTGRIQERIAVIQDDIASRRSRLERHDREIADLSEMLSFTRAREAQLRELIALKLHFTGLDVRLCPNCDEEVSEAEIEQEQETHHCRLCNKPAHDATPEEITTRRAEADDFAAQAKEYERRRTAVKREMGQLDQEVQQLRREAVDVQNDAQESLRNALPTQEEQELRDRLQHESGKLSAELSAVSHRLEQLKDAGAFDGNRRRILKKARKILQAEAELRNSAVLDKLNKLTQKVAQQIGAESITDVTCSALGRVKLTKHDETVTFTGIHNQGERMRVKLAFFLAMMRLGRESGFGRHPGLLLVDQPGSAEMVTEDFRALATVLHDVDATLEEKYQVLCFTARSEFSEATRAGKVYGPQAGKYAF